MNLISVSKIGKSWLLYSLLLSIVTGRPWLGRFPIAKGRVLLIDNELHKETLAYRLKAVAEAMGLSDDDWVEDLDVWPLRGRLLDLFELRTDLETVAGQYQAVGIDALYRMLPEDWSENDNSQMAQLYNQIDLLGDMTGAVMVAVHHSSKGSQSDKRVTDVGAGAGAQSRAADCHLILREHEEEGVIVMEAAVRSFPRVHPLGLRWDYPLWVPVEGIDLALLKGKKAPAEERQDKRDNETDAAIVRCCEAWRSRAELKRQLGWGDTRINRGIRRLLEERLLECGNEDRRGNACEVFRKRIDPS
jgi:hypothetical protein